MDYKVDCLKCKHHVELQDGPRTGRLGIWYNQRCGHPDSYMFGAHSAKSNLDDSRPYCREINQDGKCTLFEEKVDIERQLWNAWAIEFRRKVENEYS
jgi:hypothetical protein